MPRNKVPALTLEQLREGERYYSAADRRAILDLIDIRDDFKPNAFLVSGGLAKTFTQDFVGRLEALAHSYTSTGRAPAPSEVEEDFTEPLRAALSHGVRIIERFDRPPNFTASSEVIRGAKLLAKRGEGLKGAKNKKADSQFRAAMDSLQWLVACCDELLANRRKTSGRREYDRHALILGLVGLYEEAATNPSENEKITFLIAAMGPLGALDSDEADGGGIRIGRDGVRKILKNAVASDGKKRLG